MKWYKVLNCAFIAFLIISLIFLYQNEKSIYGDIGQTIQFWGIFLGSLVVIGISIFRLIDWPPLGNNFSEPITNMLVGFIAIIGIAFTILFGNIYTYALSARDITGLTARLQKMGLILLFFIGLILANLFFSLIAPLLYKNNNECYYKKIKDKFYHSLKLAKKFITRLLHFLPLTKDSPGEALIFFAYISSCFSKMCKRSVVKIFQLLIVIILIIIFCLFSSNLIFPNFIYHGSSTTQSTFIHQTDVTKPWISISEPLPNDSNFQAITSIFFSCSFSNDSQVYLIRNDTHGNVSEKLLYFKGNNWSWLSNGGDAIILNRTQTLYAHFITWPKDGLNPVTSFTIIGHRQ